MEDNSRKERKSQWIARTTAHFDTPEIRKEAEEMFEKANPDQPVVPEWEESVKEFLNDLAFASKPSNQAMEAVRLIRKTLPSLIQTIRNKTLEEAAKIAEKGRKELRHIECKEGNCELCDFCHAKTINNEAIEVAVHSIRSLKS